MDRFGLQGLWDYNTTDEYARSDKHVVYEVQFMAGIKFDVNKYIFRLQELPNENFVLNRPPVQGLYDLGVGLDFTFVIDGKEIKASKYVMGTNSVVFEAMLTNDWKDSREGRVDIEDR